MKKLYHYIHCPFCIRVRLVLGFLSINYQSCVLSYDDEQTPIKLTGKKMLPIMSFSNDKLEIMNESLEIIKKLDQNNILSLELLNQKNKFHQLEDFLNQLAGPIHNLCMPYWIYTKEFNQSARIYFEKKKSFKRGPFPLLMKRKYEFLDELKPLLIELKNQLIPFYQSQELTIFDIMIASHLWGLYIFPEFQFSEKIHSYLQTIKTKCHFEYHEDFWREV